MSCITFRYQLEAYKYRRQEWMDHDTGGSYFKVFLQLFHGDQPGTQKVEIWNLRLNDLTPFTMLEFDPEYDREGSKRRFYLTSTPRSFRVELRFPKQKTQASFLEIHSHEKGYFTLSFLPEMNTSEIRNIQCFSLPQTKENIKLVTEMTQQLLRIARESHLHLYDVWEIKQEEKLLIHPLSDCTESSRLHLSEFTTFSLTPDEGVKMEKGWRLQPYHSLRAEDDSCLATVNFPTSFLIDEQTHIYGSANSLHFSKRNNPRDYPRFMALFRDPEEPILWVQTDDLSLPVPNLDKLSVEKKYGPVHRYLKPVWAQLQWNERLEQDWNHLQELLKSQFKIKKLGSKPQDLFSLNTRVQPLKDFQKNRLTQTRFFFGKRRDRIVVKKHEWKGHEPDYRQITEYPFPPPKKDHETTDQSQDDRKTGKRKPHQTSDSSSKRRRR